MLKKLLFALLFIAGVFSCRQVPVTGRSQFIIVPASEMQAMSYTQYDQFLNQNRVVTGTEESRMIKRVGSRIQTAVEAYMAEKGLSDRLEGFEWEFNLVNDETINAWCMPGGKVVFYTGILPVCQDETGVAVVMGHEIAHAVADHGAERMSQGLVAQGISSGVGLAAQQSSPLVQQLFMGAFGIGSQVGMLAFSRKHESEADEMGLIFSAMAGYDPREAPEFWKRMSAKSGGGAPPEFLSTHPSHDRRISDLNELLPTAMQYYEKYKDRY